MSKVLYSGVDEEGREVSGYVEADSEHDAIRKLQREGVEALKLHSGAMVFDEREYLDGLSEKKLAQIAKNEIEMQKKSLQFIPYMAEKLRDSFVPILIGGAISYYGYTSGSYLIASFGAIVAFALPFVYLWLYSSMKNFEDMVKAITFGEWDRAAELASDLKENNKIIKLKQLSTFADSVIAKKEAKDGNLDKALSIMEEHREFYDKTPGLYENMLGNIYLSGKEEQKALESFQKSYEKCEGNGALIGDFALFDSLVGDIDRAKESLDEVNILQLPAYGVGYVDLIDGIVAYKKGKFADALEFLTNSYNSFDEYASNPITWSVLALNSAYLALTLDSLGDKDGAYSYLGGSVVKILSENAPSGLSSDLKEHFPSHFVG